jgi:NAD-dependent DNA ligase
MSNIERLEYRRFTEKSEIDKNLNVLEGIITGIEIDGQINDDELMELSNWLESLKSYKRIKAITEISNHLEEAISDRILSIEEKEDLLWLFKQFRTPDTKYYDLITSEIQYLHGILHGILADNVINENEIKGLKKWIFEHEELQGIYPYDELLSLVISVTTNGSISKEEENLLKVFFSYFIDIKNSRTIDIAEIYKLRAEINIQGICAVDPLIVIEQKEFCFTGISGKAKRTDFERIVNSTGGVFTNSVRKSTNFLIIGDGGNPCWAFSAYGRKVEKAMNMRKEGHPIVLVHELDFWDALDGY